ncbi:MAG: DUF4333 domain-containing protein [Miltoncostaeaceae bacterium]
MTAGLAACSAEVSVGGDPSLSGGEIAAGITEQYEERFPGLTLAEMTCRGAEAEVGAPIRCEGVNSGGVDLEFGGEITAVDEENDAADYRWEITRAVVPGSFYEERATPIIEREAQVTVQSITCPERVEIREGVEFQCEVTTTDGTTAPVTVTVTDNNGDFRVRG